MRRRGHMSEETIGAYEFISISKQALEEIDPTIISGIDWNNVLHAADISLKTPLIEMIQGYEKVIKLLYTNNHLILDTFEKELVRRDRKKLSEGYTP
jgi:hypothetical protein